MSSTFSAAGPNRFRTARFISLVASSYALAGGLVTLAGWVLDIHRLTDWNNAGISTFINAALCAVAGGLGTALLLQRPSAARNFFVRCAACFLILITGLTLLEHIFNLDLGVDTLLVNRPWGQQAATSPMRIGPPASISFFTIGITLLLATFTAPRRRVAASLGLIPLGISALSLTGYWFGADELFGIARFTGIALPTSTIIFALGIALIAALPEHGVAAALSRNDAGGTLLRRLILPVVFLPLLLGWLRTLGQQAGLYDAAFGTALRSLVEALLLLGLLWWTSASISRHAKAAETAGRRLAAIVESSDDAIVSKSLEGIIQSWNAGAQRLFGYTEKETVGRHISLIIPPERINEEAEILSRLSRGESLEHFETVRLRKDGTSLNISLTVSPIRDSAGTVIGASKIARDITEHVKAETERNRLLEAERAARSVAEQANVMKDEFLATLSHELRTPLTAILGWSEMLAHGNLSEADAREGCQAIERNARIQAQLIDDLLDMSRIAAGKVRLDVQRVDLAATINTAVESVRPSAEAKQIHLRKIVDPHAGPVSGDPTRLHQVVWNLLTNAIKFTPRDGQVDVLLQRVNSHVEITVKDSGAGIKPDFLPIVFDRFRQADASTTRAYGGLGLGLSIVKNLVELHGGTVIASSPGEGQGSTFVVKLPLAPLRGDELREHPTFHKPPDLNFDQLQLAGTKVLVVDDEPDTRELLQRLLTQCQAQVTTAKSADEALQTIRTQKPDVIISDIGMPNKDGYQFIREVRALSPEQGGKIPAVALTAYARSDDRTQAMLAGYQVHIAKPIEPKELLATVISVAARSPM